MFVILLCIQSGTPSSTLLLSRMSPGSLKDEQAEEQAEPGAGRHV